MDNSRLPPKTDGVEVDRVEARLSIMQNEGIAAAFVH